MPHHIEDGDNVAANMVMLRQTVKVEVYVPEVIRTCWFWLTRNLVRCASGEACEQKIQNVDEQMILRLRSHESEY